MQHFALFYDYAPDFRERRAPFRAAHIDLAQAWARDGRLELGGAFADDPPQGMLIFRAGSPADIEAFVRADPYVANGIVLDWRIRAWTTVVGPGALTKV